MSFQMRRLQKCFKMERERKKKHEATFASRVCFASLDYALHAVQFQAYRLLPASQPSTQHTVR